MQLICKTRILRFSMRAWLVCHRISRSEDSSRQYWVKPRGGRHLNGRRQKLTHFYQSVTRYTPKAWQTAGTVKTLIIYSTALYPLSLGREGKLLMAPTFSRAPKLGAILLPFGARSFSMAEIWRCLPWEKLAPFLSVTLCQSAHRGPRGEWISQRLLKIFLLLFESKSDLCDTIWKF